MGLESGTYVDDLVTTNPVGASDPKSQGDDHLRLIKSVLKNTFPNSDKSFRFESVVSLSADRTILTTEDRTFWVCTPPGGGMTLTLPASPANAFTVSVVSLSSNSLTVDGNGSDTINGAATRVFAAAYRHETYMWTGSEWVVVNVGHISAGYIDATRLASDAVTTVKILDANVTEAKLADGAVTTTKLADTAVNSAKLATNAVTSDKIVANAVTTAKVNDSAITTAKINDSAVTTAKINDAAVTFAKLAGEAVTDLIATFDDTFTAATELDITLTQAYSKIIGVFSGIFSSDASSSNSLRLRVYNDSNNRSQQEVISGTGTWNGGGVIGKFIIYGCKTGQPVLVEYATANNVSLINDGSVNSEAEVGMRHYTDGPGLENTDHLLDSDLSLLRLTFASGNIDIGSGDILAVYGVK